MNTEKNGERGIDKDIDVAHASGKHPTDVMEPKTHDRRTLYWTVRDKFGYSHLGAVLMVCSLENGTGNDVFAGGIRTVAQLQKSKAAQKFVTDWRDNCEQFARSIESITNHHNESSPADLLELLNSLDIGDEKDDGGEADDIRKGRV